MKAFQKTIAAAAALLLCLSLCVSAFAADEPEADLTWEEITAKVLAEYGISEDTVYAGYRNLVTGEEHYIQGDEYAIAASMTKVPVCMYFTEVLTSGEFDWSPYEPYFTYEELRDKVLIESSNEGYSLLLDLLGGYEVFRNLTAHYMGVEPGSERVDITMYNNYTPREFINCLTYLYEQSERFPGIIETMQKAMTDGFFKRNEPRFRIAHKPGWISEDYILNDCAICFTTQPIAIVMMTKNPLSSEDFLSAWCTAMCMYTERQAQLAEATPAPEAEPEPAQTSAPATPAPAQTPAPAPVTPDRAPLPRIVSIAAVGLFVLLGLILILILCVRRRARFIGLFLALLLSAGAMYLSAAGLYDGTIYARPAGDPSACVTRFFDAVCAGDYDTAYGELRDYADLGLGERPASPAGQKVYDALHASWSYTLDGDCRTDKLDAVQPVRFTYLDLARLEQAVADETQVQIEKIVQVRPANQIYDENRHYLPEVADEAYLAAMDAVLRHASDFYSESAFELSMAYTDGRWQLLASPALLRALSGGVGY